MKYEQIKELEKEKFPILLGFKRETCERIIDILGS
jgi:hypothetical protein